jgi:hypothetical protein
MRVLRDGSKARWTLRLIARRVAMRANSIEPPRSAALAISSAAVRTTGMPRSDEGKMLKPARIV